MTTPRSPKTLPPAHDSHPNAATETHPPFTRTRNRTPKITNPPTNLPTLSPGLPERRPSRRRRYPLICHVTFITALLQDALVFLVRPVVAIMTQTTLRPHLIRARVRSETTAHSTSQTGEAGYTCPRPGSRMTLNITRSRRPRLGTTRRRHTGGMCRIVMRLASGRRWSAEVGGEGLTA